MYFSLFGVITHIFSHHIVINVNDVSYELLVARPSIFKLNEKITIYTYQVIRENEQFLIGFSSLEEKEAFLLLTSVKGVGVKTALNILKEINPSDLYNAISHNNLQFLKNLPGIGNKVANQILFDLKNKVPNENKTKVSQYQQVKDALKNLGFKNKEIDDALNKTNVINKTNEELLKEALSKLKPKYEQNLR